MSLHLLPLMMMYEINDIMFFIKQLKNPTDSFDIRNYVEFCSSSYKSRSTSTSKLKHQLPYSSAHSHFYFNRLPRLWNYLPQINLNLSVDTIKKRLMEYFWSHFLQHFDPSNTCTLHLLCPCAGCSSIPRPSTQIVL